MSHGVEADTDRGAPLQPPDSLSPQPDGYPARRCRLEGWPSETRSDLVIDDLFERADRIIGRAHGNAHPLVHSSRRYTATVSNASSGVP